MRSDSAILSSREVWNSRVMKSRRKIARSSRRLLTQATSIGNDSWKSLYVTCVTYVGMEGRGIHNRHSVCGRFFFIAVLRCAFRCSLYCRQLSHILSLHSAPRSSPLRKEKRKTNEQGCFSSIVVISESAEALWGFVRHAAVILSATSKVWLHGGGRRSHPAGRRNFSEKSPVVSGNASPLAVW